MATFSPQQFSSRVSIWLVLASLVLVFVVGVGVYSFTQRMVLKSRMDILNTEKTQFADQIAEYESQNVRQILHSREFLQSLQASVIPWSRAVRDVLMVTPKAPPSGTPTADYLSFSGGMNGTLTITGNTAANSVDPFGDLAQLIQVFSSAPTFRDAFVPTISRGLTEKGETLLSFVLNITYHE